MSYSKVDVANMALAHLGKESILSLSENSVEARTANFWYDKACRLALGRSPWTFAREILTLSLLTNDYEERWEFKYDLPASAQGVYRIIPKTDPLEEVQGMPIKYQRIGTALYTNEPDAKAMIVLEDTNPSRWPDDFVLAVSYVLARHMSPKLTRKGSYLQDMNTLYEQHLGLAIEHDAGQEPNYHAYASQYLMDRDADQRTLFDGKRAVDGSIYWNT